MNEALMLTNVALLCGVIVLILLLVIKQKDHTARLNQQQANIEKQLSVLTIEMDRKITDMFERSMRMDKESDDRVRTFLDATRLELQKIQESIERRLFAIDTKVNESLEQGFEKTNKTFVNIVERLSKIDEAQKKIDALSTDIVSLQDILTDKKTRGTFGEIQLGSILSAVFGEGATSIVAEQYRLPNGTRVDAMLFAPQPLGHIAIDSKFPLENYRIMMDKNIDKTSRLNASKQFVIDCKRHIDAIASKYIIEDVTSDQALMFVPAEAIFAEITAYHEDIMIYAQKKRVWIVSPTTLMSTLTTIQTILKNMEREKYAAVIHDQLKLLAVEFDRYQKRWEDLDRRMNGVQEDFRKINTTSEKITKRFHSIANVETIDGQKNDLIE